MELNCAAWNRDCNMMEVELNFAAWNRDCNKMEVGLELRVKVVMKKKSKGASDL